jgi:hypothetical protein
MSTTPPLNTFEDTVWEVLMPTLGASVARMVVDWHHTELDRKVLEARIDELKILRIESEVTMLGVKYIDDRIAELEARVGGGPHER